MTAGAGRRPGRIGVVVGMLALTAGCALGPQAQPVALSTNPARGQPTKHHTGAFTVKVSERVYLVHNGRLVEVSRTTPLRNTHLQTVMGALFEPLGFLERNEGLRSALPPSKQPVRVQVHGHLATVQLPEGFDGLAVSEQILALGQLVFTISANSDAFEMRFKAGKRAVPVPDGGGRLLTAPVTRDDYVRIAP